MTIAVCVFCGELKHGAFNPCSMCGKRPEIETDVAYSLALTDHYFAKDTLDQISHDMLAGKKRPSLPKDQEEKFIKAAREYIQRFGAALGFKIPTNSVPEDKPSNRIRIHPRGQGRITNEELANKLEKLAPKSFRIVQDVLLAAEKYNAGPSFFRSRSKLIRNLQRCIYELEEALIRDNYRPDLANAKKVLLFSFLSDFSDAFPNWQPEYDTLNKFIPKIY